MFVFSSFYLFQDGGAVCGSISSREIVQECLLQPCRMLGGQFVGDAYSCVLLCYTVKAAQHAESEAREWSSVGPCVAIVSHPVNEK